MRYLSLFCTICLALPLFLSGCAQSQVKRTYVATTTVDRPEGIYIRPFDITDLKWEGDHGSRGETVIDHSIAPAELAMALRYELAKLAPALIIEPDQAAPEGWIVEGDILVDDAGSRIGRAVLPHTGIFRSTIVVRTRVIDAQTNRLLYEFDVTGGSGLTGPLGTMGGPGLGVATQFDYKNTAETIMLALSKDPFRFGHRSSPSVHRFPGG